MSETFRKSCLTGKSYGWLMIMVFVVTVSPQSILLIIARVPGDFLVGMNLLNVSSRILLHRKVTATVVTGKLPLRDRHIGLYHRSG
jgi:hypothetical protein